MSKKEEEYEPRYKPTDSPVKGKTNATSLPRLLHLIRHQRTSSGAIGLVFRDPYVRSNAEIKVLVEMSEQQLNYALLTLGVSRLDFPGRRVITSMLRILCVGILDSDGVVTIRAATPEEVRALLEDEDSRWVGEFGAINV